MTEAIVRQALSLWDLEGSMAELVAARENAVYRVESGETVLALRLHRAGLRSPAELASELDWMAMLGHGGLTLPRPIPLPDGRLCADIDGIVVDMLSWLDGHPMGRDGRLALEGQTAVFAYEALGREMARLHQLSDGWTPGPDFSRPRWDRDGLVGESPLWGRFWENPLLDPSQTTLLQAARRLAASRLDALAGAADFGLIHADLVPENVIMREDGRPQLIDFDDGGWGFRLFDLATVANRALREEDHAALTAAFLAGYQSVRPIDLDHLPLFSALRSFTYVGWIVPRLQEDGALPRAHRAISLACRLAVELLGG